MVLQYYGVKDHAWDLAKEFEIGHDDLFWPWSEFFYPWADTIEKYINRKGLKMKHVLSPPPRLHGTFFEEYIQAPVDNKTPVIILYSGHAVVIVGYSIESNE